MTAVPEQIHRILIVKPSSLGDILHLFPALERLHRAWPHAKVDFLVHPAFAGILDYSPCPIRRKIMFRRRELGRITTLVPEFFRLARELRQERYDLVIDFQGLFRSALFAGLTRSSRVIGFADPREASAKFFYNSRIKVPPGHAIERYFNLAAAVIREPAGEMVRTELPVNSAIRAELERKLGKPPERYVVLLPGARWESKRFPPELFAEVARELHRQEPKMVFVVLGVKADAKLETAIAAALPPDFPLVRCCGKTSLPEMMEMLRTALAVISNDSGPVHAAAALGRPVYAFFGPTDPGRTGPYGSGGKTYQLGLDCIKCLKRSCPIHPAPPCHALDAGAIANDILRQASGDKPEPAMTPSAKEQEKSC